MNIPIERDCPNCGATIIFYANPGTPPPPCSNPSNPRFADSGTPAEFAGPESCPNCKAHVPDTLIDEVIEAAIDHAA